jgi:hypothetical protein
MANPAPPGGSSTEVLTLITDERVLASAAAGMPSDAVSVLSDRQAAPTMTLRLSGKSFVVPLTALLMRPLVGW